MKLFSDLYMTLDQTKSTLKKIQALVEYFRIANLNDAAWTVCLLCGERPKRLVSSTTLRIWLGEATGIKPWLIDDCYAVVGDLAETITLLTESLTIRSSTPPPELHELLDIEVPRLRKLDEPELKSWMLTMWSQLEFKHRFLLNKILMGGFRVGVSKQTVIKALAKFTAIDEAEMAHRLTGHLYPTSEFFTKICSKTKVSGPETPAKPYPFYLASPLANEPKELGSPAEWSAEWKWDGIRGQAIKRADQIFIWSRGEELVTDSFPDLSIAFESLPNGTVLDGEIVAMNEDQNPAPFSQLQKRLGRKKPSQKFQKDYPVGFIAYDILEYRNQDIRHLSQRSRTKHLSDLLETSGHKKLRISPQIEFSSWQQLAEARSKAREEKAEGLMIKSQSGAYQVGRKRGHWWKWKTEPFRIDAILLYAQAGHGRRANLFTDYTLALWEGETLVPVAKAYSGLSDEELKQLDSWIKKNTKEKFGPVRSVKCEQVLEIAFEGINASKRHKSGFALRFPRIARWRRDKSFQEADHLQSLAELWNQYGKN